MAIARAGALPRLLLVVSPQRAERRRHGEVVRRSSVLLLVSGSRPVGRLDLSRLAVQGPPTHDLPALARQDVVRLVRLMILVVVEVSLGLPVLVVRGRPERSAP
jgi:hypothetical protein